ncbi:MAG: hypothetical protein HQK84_10760 [Nitrospinae bacterium]|nr:hypothetical protein [Nitrospinota bacterium]
MKKIILIPFLFLFGCVASTMQIPEPDSMEAQLFSERCSSCHSLPHPQRHTFEQWKQVVSIMQIRMKERDFQQLEKNEESAILAYLKKHSQ